MPLRSTPAGRDRAWPALADPAKISGARLALAWAAPPFVNARGRVIDIVAQPA